MEMAIEVQADATADTEEVDRIAVHSPRLNCNAYLLDLLNAAVWLAERSEVGKYRERSIEILLHPVGSPWVRGVCAFFDLSRIPSLVRRIVGRLRPLASEWGSHMARQGPTIIERVRIQSSGVRIQFGERLTIGIQRIELGYVESAGLTIRACCRALRHWRNCHQNGRLNVQALLLLRYRDVQIGDLIASDTIGANPTAGGSLRRCGTLALFRCLVDAIYTVDYILGRTWNVHDHDYVTTSETTYLDEIYRRTLRSRGLSVLELYDYTGRLRIIAPGEEWPNPFVARAWQQAALSIHQRERARQYLAERVSDAGRHLWYMYVGRNVSGKVSAVDEGGHVVARDDQSLTVIIFLHSFDDAQYFFGLDGFEDLYEWTVVSIAECLGNRHIGRILIKEHPNVDPVRFPGDKRAIERLRDRYQHKPRITFIDRHTDIKVLPSLGRVYGITNYGSVAEELVAVGLPVIASSKGPWGKSYPFLHVWDSPGEYVAILRGLTTADWGAPESREKEALYQFVNEYRLNVLPGQDLPIPVQWMVWEDSSIDILARDISDKAEHRIAELKPDSPQLLDWLRDRARAYRRSRNTGGTSTYADRSVRRLAQG
jgi:hypothetical protein